MKVLKDDRKDDEMTTRTNEQDRLIALVRERNSVNGNPKYLVIFESGRKYRTASDYSFVYGITNGWVGEMINFEVGGRGTIVNMEKM